MIRFFKRLVLGWIDYVLRVALWRIDAVKQALSAEAAAQQRQALLAASEGPSDSAGIRRLQVQPFIYPAAARNASAAAEHPKYFLVTSQGLAASAWLASSLNLHPDITCSMGIDHPFVSMQFYYNEDLISAKMNAVQDAGEIKHGFYRESLRELYKKRFAEKGFPLNTDLVRVNPIRQLQIMYDELEWFAPAKHYGNVHSCFAMQALEYLKEAPTKRDVTLMNLIRHPLPRTEAAIKGILSIPELYPDSDWHRGITEEIDKFTEEQPEMRRDIENRFGVDFTKVRNRGVLYSYYRALHNDCWANEVTMCREACHVTIERLMNDRDYFSWFVWELTQQDIAVTPEYLDQIFSEEHLRSGRHTGKGNSIRMREQYERWTDWEKYEFKLAMDRLDLANVYAPFGYDLSFVR